MRKKLGIKSNVDEVSNGREALDYLRRKREQPHEGGPIVIILDLNTPVMSGHEFLDELRGDEALRRSMVFVLSTSAAETDLKRAYDKNVAGYFVKYSDLGRFSDSVNALHTYCSTIKLPDAPTAA